MPYSSALVSNVPIISTNSQEAHPHEDRLGVGSESSELSVGISLISARRPIENGEVGATSERSEQYMGSREWLYRHGLRPRKLDLYDALSLCSFKHCDGVVDVKGPPDDEYTDAVSDFLMRSKISLYWPLNSARFTSVFIVFYLNFS